MMAFLRTYGAALASGFFLATAFPSFSWYPLAWAALVPLLLAERKLPLESVFKHFLLAGWVFYSVQWYWLAVNMYWAGGWAIVGQQALCIYMALYWGIVGLTFAWVRRRVQNEFAAAICLAILWAAMEQLQGTFFTGFSAGALAYSQGADLPLLQWAALGGSSLVAAIIICVSALLAAAIAAPKRKILYGLGAVGIALAAHGIGFLLLAPPDLDSRPLKVGILQTNFPIEMKHDYEYTDEMISSTVKKSIALAEYGHPDLLVWPEALIMSSIEVPHVREMLSALPLQTGAALFTGSARSEYDPYRAYNSSYFIDKSGAIGEAYDKIHLAPFGEYLPLAAFLPFIHQLVPAISAISAGEQTRIYAIEGRRFGPMICFEVLFPQMAERLRSEGADFLVVITNLGWFGKTNAIPQELEAARLRAIETRLPLVHCANTGISGVFDPWGRFTLVNGTITSSGAFTELREDLRPRQTIGNRLVGLFSLPAPGVRPIPHAPWLVPWIFVGIAFAIPLAVAAFPRRPMAAKDLLGKRK